jgi:hypothetical protein
VVVVLGAVLVFYGWMDMNQRCCKYPDQERCTEYCHASSSHNLGIYLIRIPESRSMHPLGLYWSTESNR